MGANNGGIWRARSNNAHYRIRELTLPPSVSTGLQRFEFKTTFLPHGGGKLLVKTRGDRREIEIRSGELIEFGPGTEVELVNKTDQQLRFTVGEFK